MILDLDFSYDDDDVIVVASQKKRYFIYYLHNIVVYQVQFVCWLRIKGYYTIVMLWSATRHPGTLKKILLYKMLWQCRMHV